MTASLLSVVTALPLASRICTVTAGLIVEPAGVLVGCWPKASWLAVPGVMLKVEDVAAPRLPEVPLSV